MPLDGCSCQVGEAGMRKRSLLAALVILASIFFLSLSFISDVRATTLYVGGGGPGNYTTIQAAIDSAGPGDTVFVFSGTYNENVVLDKTISLMGESVDTTFINAGGVGDTVYLTASWANITGFTITGSEAGGIEAGIRLHYAHNCNVSWNNVSGNGFGITLYQARNNTIAHNNLFSNSDNIAMYVSRSINTTIVHNTMSQNGIYVDGEFLEHWNSHTIDTTNTVDGDPVYYWKDIVGGTVPSDAAQVILANCSHWLVEGLHVDNSSVAIQLGFSSNNTIANNTAVRNRMGIHIANSSNNTIVGNNVSDNYFGIFVSQSDDNSLFHNVFINNTAQVYESGSNQWDDGYPSGGNYWSDYAGIDEKSGPNQSEGGSDGIGDTPHDISGGASQDRYPFMKPMLEFNNPPTASFTVTPPEGNTTTVFIVDASISSDPEDPTISLEFRWDCEDDGTWDDFLMTSQCQYSTPGTYTIRLEVRDTRGRMDSTTQQVIVRAIENQHPTCSITEPEQGDVISENYTVRGTASDPDGVVEKVEIRIDDGPWIQVTGTSSWSYEWNTTDVSDGNHTIYARSYDGGNYSEEMSVTVRVDNVIPPTPAEEESVFEQAWFWIAVALVIVVILLAVLILVRRRKEKQGEGESPESG